MADAVKETKDIDVKLLVISLLLLVPTTALRGYVLTQLWQWFVVPLGMAAIGLWHACGIALLAAAFTHSRWLHLAVGGLDKRDDNTKLRQHMALDTIAPLLAWGVGALYHWLAGVFA